MLCGDLDMWDGGREIQEEGDICMHIADSLGFTAKINTCCKINYTSIFSILLVKKEKKKKVAPSGPKTVVGEKHLLSILNSQGQG